MDDRAQGEQVEAGDSYWSDWAREANSSTSRSDVDEEASNDINVLLVSEGHSLASSLESGSDSGDVQMQTTNMLQHHLGLSGGISVSHSFPILTIRPPATEINSGGFPGVVTCGIAAADKESGGETLCSKEEPHAVQSREKKLRFESTQVSFHLKRGDNLLEKSWLERDDNRSMEQGDADDMLDPQWRTKSGHEVSDVNIDSCNLPSKRNHVSHSPLYFEQHRVANTSDKKSDDNMLVDSWHSRSSCLDHTYLSDVIHERIKRNVQSDLSTNCHGFEPHWPMQCSYEVGKPAPEKGQQLMEDVSKSMNIMIDSSFNGLYREPFTSLRQGFNSPTSSHSLGRASTVLSRLCGADSVPTEQAHLVLKTMHCLSELFLFQCSNGPWDLKVEDYHILKSVINNVNASLKHLQQGTERQQFPSSPPRPAQLFGKSTAQSGRSEEVQMSSVQANGQGQSTLPQVSEERIRYLVQGDPNKGDAAFVPSDDLDEVGNDKMTQAIKKILIDNLDDKVEPDLQIQCFKNLWLEAEARLYSMKFRSCFRRMKTEMERLKSFQRDSSDNIWEREKSLSLNPSFYSPAEDKSVLQARCHANQNTTTQFLPALNAGTNTNDVMARFNILKDRGFNSAGDEGKCVSPENSKVGHNPDDVLARFNILKGRDFNSHAMSAGDDVECVSHVDFKSQNLVEDDELTTRTFPIGGFVEGNSDNFPVNIPTNQMDDVNASVVKRLSILRQRDDSLVSVNIQGMPKEAASLGSFLKKDYFSGLSEKTDVLSLRKSSASVHYTASPADGMLTSKDVCTVLEDDEAPQSQCVGGSTNLNVARRSDNSPISSDWELCGEGDLSAEG